MNNKKILVVDDEPVIRTLLERVLSKAGYEAVLLSDAESGLAKALEEEFSMVISDIRMPGKNGIWLLTEIKKSLPDVPVVMLTASDNIQDAIVCLQMGAEQYVLKPFNFDELLHAVEKSIEKRALILRDRQNREWTEEELARQQRENERLVVGAIQAFATSLEAKDEYTRGHSDRVVGLSTAIAAALGLPKELVEKLKVSSVLHDIGKIGIREVILNKPGPLTPEEFTHVKLHVTIGERIISPVIQDADIRAGVRQHHERYDGTGYPDGIAGSKISLTGRIICLADTFEAMTADRPYRKSFSLDETKKRIQENAGTQFDPDIVKAFLDRLEKDPSIFKKS